MISVSAAFTERSLERLATGAPMNFAGADLFELYAPVPQGSTRAVFSKGDTADAPLIIIAESSTGSFLPDGLRKHQEAALHRMLNFVQRSKSLPLSLPRGWRQYKHDNLMAFYALPESFGSDRRWIAEINVEGTHDIVFWEVAPTADQNQLSEYIVDHGRYREIRKAWESRFSEGMNALSGPSASTSGIDVDLAPAPQVQGVSKSRTFRQWLSYLTDSQRQFVDAPTDHAIRLRGPAGSGKSLSLAVKAVQLATNARRNGESTPRILFVTHSWALAGEVDQLTSALSEEGPLPEINILPLVAVAQEIMPTGLIPTDLHLIGDDSLTGKTAQLAQIEEVIEEFRQSNWITYKAQCSKDFVARMDSDDPSVLRGLAWDFLIEFGCVLGADGIFPGLNAEKRYLKLPRAPWMMRLDTAGDKRATYALYAEYHQALAHRSLLTSDQLLSDFLNYLDGFTWNHRRRMEGYDYIFVDEFHLFNTLERQILRSLSREVSAYPRIFMALDPRQSPWDVYFGTDDAKSTSAEPIGEDELEAVTTVDIPTVHRSSPQILDLIKHIHLDYANLNLDADWNFAISEVESLAGAGPRPSMFITETFAEEEIAIYNAIREVYPHAHLGAQVALALLDEESYSRYRPLIERVSNSGRFGVIPITSREDVEVIRYQRRGIVVGPAEYLAGLQFDTVLIAGLHDVPGNTPNQGVRRRGALSLLYLAVSRAARDVRIFSNDDFGGIPEVLSRAGQEGVLGIFRV